MELDDHEFDAAFRKRMVDTEPQFEEAAWDKMEQRLRRRDRVLVFRKGSLLVLLFLLIGWIGYDLLEPGLPKIPKTQLAQQRAIKENKPFSEKKRGALQAPKVTRAEVSNDLSDTNDSKAEMVALPILGDRNIQELSASSNRSDHPGRVQQLLAYHNRSKLEFSKVQDTSVLPKKKGTKAKRLPISMALSVAPEFNSTTAMIGGQTGMNIGFGFSLGIANHLKIQTGVMYSRKDYSTDNYSYKFRNPGIQQLVSGIDASCAVLEIPVLASYTVIEDRKRSIDLNLGMSSYLMLKEDYTFKYSPQSGIPNRLLVKENANQHYLSVVALSATYFIKLKTEKVKIGLEPFLKIPLTGVGEGQVNLKSSGVSLKISYDLRK